MSRGVLVGGNWKSNGTQESILKLSQGLKSMHVPEGVEVVVSPMLLHTSAVLSTLGSTSRVAVASQNCSAHNDGAYTGEVSAFALVDSGLPWVILGHSERRALFGDTDEVVGVKLAKALEAGLKVILCVGESLSDREHGKTMEVVLRQLSAANVSSYDGVVIAYEPVWAIGTGLTATPDQAQQVHHEIRKWLPEVAKNTRIIYGGSVKPDNAKDLISQPDIDGFLVGGASLKADAFSAIVAASRL